MRQFGLQQAIPTPFPFDSNHFRHDRRGRPNTNWELEHAHWLSFWNQRLQYSCDAPVNKNHFAMMIHILFGSGALIVLLLVILIHVLKINKVMCLIRRHMKL